MVKKFIIIFLAVTAIVFYFSGAVQAAVPAGCLDVDENSCIDERDCGAPGNESCDICPAGNCGQLPVEDGGDGGIINDGAPAATNVSDENGSWDGIDLTIQDVFAIINGLVCWASRIAVVLMVIFIILAGLRYMAARDNPTALTVANKNFRYVLIGLVVIMGVYVIIATVANAVGVKDFSFIPLVC